MRKISLTELIETKVGTRIAVEGYSVFSSDWFFGTLTSTCHVPSGTSSVQILLIEESKNMYGSEIMYFKTHLLGQELLTMERFFIIEENDPFHQYFKDGNQPPNFQLSDTIFDNGSCNHSEIKQVYLGIGPGAEKITICCKCKQELFG